MFETHQSNSAWVGELIDHLAYPRITSSLAVTVYRSLPNATDFNIWDGELGWNGFNYATIGDAYRYHQPHDLPENVSDRTLQHMGNHVLSMRRAVDELSSDDVRRLSDQTAAATRGNAVFFDLFGAIIIHYSEWVQKVFAGVLLVLVCVSWRRNSKRGQGPGAARQLFEFLLAIALGLLIGIGAYLILAETAYENLVYTPVDRPAGLITIAISFVVVTFFLENLRRRRRSPSGDFESDVVWGITASLAIALAFAVPGGAYLLIWPATIYWVVRLVTRKAAPSAGCGWIALTLLAGPLLGLLVQALGPWKQPLYATIAGLLAIAAMTAWNAASIDVPEQAKPTEP